MADKQGSVTFDSIMRDLRAGNYRPVYLLAGDEPYYIDKIADYITENALKPEERDFNQTIFYGLDTSPCRPFFSNSRLPSARPWSKPGSIPLARRPSWATWPSSSS